MTRTLLDASLMTVGCTIPLHLSLPPEELARLRAPAALKEPAETAEAAKAPAAAAAAHPRGFVERDGVTEHCPLDDAQAAYIDGDYVGALQKAVHSNHAGWRIIAATACALHDEAWVTRAVENLNPIERGWLRDVCRRQGLVLTNLDSQHPRVLRTAGLDDDEEE